MPFRKPLLQGLRQKHLLLRIVGEIAGRHHSTTFTPSIWMTYRSAAQTPSCCRQGLGHTVAVAYNARSALDSAERESFDHPFRRCIADGDGIALCQRPR